MSKTFPQAITILVVEDEPGDFNLARTYVRMAGLGHVGGEEPVIWAQTLAEGITLARSNKPDVVLLDLSLPDSSGIDTVRAMRAALPECAIVVLTGNDDNALSIAALEASAQDYLVKGRFDHDVLRHAVRNAMVREALESRLRLFEAALNSAADGIVITDTESRVQWANPAFTQLTGFTQEEALGRTPGELVKSGKYDQAFYQNMWQTILSGRPWRGELINRRKDGTLYHEGLAIAPVTGGDGTVQHFIAIKKDISERKQLEKDLQNLNATLEKRVEEELAKNRSKDLLLIQQSRLASLGEMVHNISHHWRQPLTALGLIVQNIQMDYRDNLLSAEELEKQVASAQKSIQRMTRTIDDFRDFFKPSKERRPFLAVDEVEKAIDMISQVLARDEIEITLDKSAGACSAFGHPSEFAQVVLNVLTNAREAIGDKNTVRKIHLKIEKNENAVIAAIRNSGGSIPETILGKVFDPYFSTKENGAGIGLYLSKMIMQNMGGDITIHNVGDEVEVLISLPLAGKSAG